MRWLKLLYVQVLFGITLGVAIGLARPEIAIPLKALGDGFISLVKMLIGPIVFVTVVQGIAHSGEMRKVGRVGGKALAYFEVVSGGALALGLVAVNLLKPGAGFHVDPSTLDPAPVAAYAQKAQATSTLEFFLNLIPKTFGEAFTGSGDLLQILLLALLTGYALTQVGERGKSVRELLASIHAVLFRAIHLIVKLAPLGAFGAMAFTIGKYGVSSFGPLLKLMGTFYLTCAVFVFAGLGVIARLTGFSLLRLLGYLREELLTVLGTSSSETVLVPLMEKLERLGCSKPVVGLVIPTGYSFNLDGTNIYLTMAAVFIAQALDVDLTIGQQISLLVIASLTGNGASGVTGAGFITLAATLAVVPSVPVAGLTLILGIDRFMSEARALTNTIGNAVATIVVAAWEGELDRDRLREGLAWGPTWVGKTSEFR